MPRRILLLGPTGVEKAAVYRQLIADRERAGQDVENIRYVDFYKDFIQERLDLELWTFSLRDMRDQRNDWRRAWELFLEEIEGASEDIILALHGTIIRALYGVRAVFEFPRYSQIQADRHCDVDR